MEVLAALSPLQIGMYLIGIVVILLLVYHLASKGGVYYKGKGLQIGAGQEKERMILRRQMEYVIASVNEAMTEIGTREGEDEWKRKFISEKVIDVLNDAISFNHVSTDRSYILLKQLCVWSEIQKTGIEIGYYKSDEFKSLVYKWVEDAIKDILEIRKFLEEQK